MDTSKRRFIRLAIVTATAAGVALASPVVAVADESEVIEEASAGESSNPPVAPALTAEPLVIELVVEGTPPIGSTESPDGAVSEESAGADAMPTAMDSEPIGADPSPTIAALETGGGDEHTGGTGGTGGTGDTGGTGEEHDGGTGEEHDGGTGGEHDGGTGGTGDPYRMTFEVSWQLPDGSVIPVIEVPTDWREMFDLAAASATGGGKPTSAHCTYPEDSTDLVCEFDNPGKHSSVTDGMVVPRKPTATYTVTVLWPVSGWTIDGANADAYSARDVCTGGGHGGGGGHSGGGGHDSGHGETLEAARSRTAGRQSASTPW